MEIVIQLKRLKKTILFLQQSNDKTHQNLHLCKKQV